MANTITFPATVTATPEETSTVTTLPPLPSATPLPFFDSRIVPDPRFGNCHVDETGDVGLDGQDDWRKAYLFDHAGLPLRVRRYDKYGALSQEVQYRFGDFGIESVTFDQEEPVGQPDFENVYAYDETGRLERVTVVNSHGTVWSVRTYTYKYGPGGQTTTIHYDRGADGVVEAREIIHYNLQGHEDRHEHDTDGDGEPELLYILTWEDGLLRRDKEEILGHLSIYQYDERRRLEKYSEYPGDGAEVSLWIAYRYDDNDYLIGSDLYYGETDLAASPTYAYDRYGRPSQEEDQVILPPFAIRFEYTCK